MNTYELADAMEIRASIRRQATSRKSVTEGANDRLADQLEQAATMLRQQEVEIERITSKYEEMLHQQQLKIEALKALLVEEQDESFDRTASHMAGEYVSYTKELTDEEIGQFKGEWYRNDYASFYDLVRAILRKAHEK